MIMKVYDATDQILGRLSTHVAKDLLKGENVFVVNCEKARLSGNPTVTKEKYLKKRQRGDPRHGPYFPRMPDGVVMRTIRGMLPTKFQKGQKALRRLKVLAGLPKEFEKQELIHLEDADVNRLKCKSISVEELSLWLGAPKRW